MYIPIHETAVKRAAWSGRGFGHLFFFFARFERYTTLALEKSYYGVINLIEIAY